MSNFQQKMKNFGYKLDKSPLVQLEIENGKFQLKVGHAIPFQLQARQVTPLSNL
jgi:hypothetical protein